MISPEKRRTALAVIAAAGVAVSASLPPSAPGWLFWGAVIASCAAAAAWGWMGERDAC